MKKVCFLFPTTPLSFFKNFLIRFRDGENAAVITESAKFGRRALTRFASLDDIDLLVTDDGLDIKK